ncbi:Uncharacterised protein [Vibrio cholerae]|nr:Uncharacterised protein [Vibrio cholerae]CSC77627.1 Uncharacterised protein [Vibrio cholerae]CSI62454.1 Uncharacterised protein [Vibrio cholerae]
MLCLAPINEYVPTPKVRECYLRTFCLFQPSLFLSVHCCGTAYKSHIHFTFDCNQFQ